MSVGSAFTNKHVNLAVRAIETIDGSFSRLFGAPICEAGHDDGDIIGITHYLVFKNCGSFQSELGKAGLFGIPSCR